MSEANHDAGGFLGRVIGGWSFQPAPWMRAVADAVRARPWRRLGLPGLGLALALALLAAWLRPVPPPPDAVTVAVQAPNATDYATTPPRIAPLRVRFSAGVAPLAVIGAGEGAATAPSGLELRPAHPGRWAWHSDQELRFVPAGDWPLGQDFELRIDTRRALAAGTVLAADRHRFTTPGFTASVQSTEFHQDPTSAALKRGVFTLAFSHPVDPASLERRVALRMSDGAGRRLPVPGHQVRLDERGLVAWVQSEPLELPENGGTLALALGQGVASRLPGAGTAEGLQAEVALPALYSVELAQARLLLVDNAEHTPEQVLSLVFNHELRDTDVAGAVRAWLLPERREARAGETPPRGGWRVPYPWTAQEIDATLLEAAEPLALELLPPERDYSLGHSFRYQAPPGRRVWIEVERGLESFGGFRMGRPQAQVLGVPPYPRLLRFVGEGSLLSLRGERRISVVARNTPALRLEVGRVLPDQLHHFADTHSGRLSRPDLWQVGEDALVERFETRLRMPDDDPARPNYAGIDLSPFFDGSRRGVFLLSLREFDPAHMARPAERTLAENAGRETDRRLVVLTDLGVIAKRGLDGRQDVFVQSLSGRGQVAGARVAAIARNGSTLVSASTDARGHARLPSLDGFTRERAPVMLVVTLGEDMSFLPLDRRQRVLDTSRFDVGGEPNTLDGGQLRAVLFSDRGLYRPGETVHLGLILRAAEWSRSVEGLPMELVVTDPRGQVARRERVAFGAEGFEEARFTPAHDAASGPWQAALYLIQDRDRRRFVAATTVQVREFQPDTMRVRATLGTGEGGGWLHPQGLEARVEVENLFGTPAADRRVEARMQLRPVLPAFTGWPGFRFHDPRRAGEGVTEDLEDTGTDAEGQARLPLGLERYENANYRVDLLVRAFEPGSGRGVATRAEALVSEAPHLDGVRAPGRLDWVRRGERREVELVAIGPDGRARALDGLRAVRIERRFVSVLARGNDGLYRYVSRERRDEREVQPLALAEGPQALVLDTGEPGDWTLEIRDGADAVLNRIDWTVAGEANLTRSLERDTELAISLDRRSYAPGDTIEVSLRAPWPGRGLITIERESVFAHAWFEADTSASVQRIRLPEGIEGNAYVSVQFLRDPDAPDLFTSPLSWGVAPFEVDREARTLPVALEHEASVRPGDEQRLRVRTGGSARVAVFAVDEGILQVAGHRVDDPLDHFLRKRMHQVQTAQILDLLLPEFSRFQALAAPGGDGEPLAARHLNPFARRGEAPAVWWSGLVDSDGEAELGFTLPDHFNGRVRLVAVAVDAGRIGITESSQVVRGDFVLLPTVPTHVAPGDRFELPVGIAFTAADAAGSADLTLQVELDEGLRRIGEAPLRLRLDPGAEGLLRLTLEAGEEPGPRAVTLVARADGRESRRRIELSVRPAAMHETRLRLVQARQETVIDGLRDLHGAFAERHLAAAHSPLVAIHGYGRWLQGFIHACTEQQVSQLVPWLVQASQPALATDAGADADAEVARRIRALRGRQNDEGGFGLWRATREADAFVTAWTALSLVEARERGLDVPADMLDAANRQLRALAADRARGELHELRVRALAVYVLARQGQQVGDLLATLSGQAERDHPDHWRDDSTGGLVAASFQLLRQDRAAAPLAARMRQLAAAPPEHEGFEHFSDPLIAQAWRVFLLHRHFPGEAARLPATAVDHLLEPIGGMRFNTLGAGLAILALEAVDAGAEGLPGLWLETADGRRQAFGTPQGRIVAGSFGEGAVRLGLAPGDARAWALLTEAGYERAPPPAVQDQGLEVHRDFLDADGRPVTRVPVGGELTVRIRLRARGGRAWSDIAVTDLLPGGFERVDAGGGSLRTAHVEAREDRTLVYATAEPVVREYLYRVRATAVGRFAVPPIHAESMYRPQVLGRGPAGGVFEVTAAGDAGP